MVAGLTGFAMADEAGRALIRTLQKAGAGCAVHLVATHTLGDAAGMEREAGVAEPEGYQDGSNKEKAYFDYLHYNPPKFYFFKFFSPATRPSRFRDPLALCPHLAMGLLFSEDCGCRHSRHSDLELTAFCFLFDSLLLELLSSTSCC
jgi:hypothetical protein